MGNPATNLVTFYEKRKCFEEKVYLCKEIFLERQNMEEKFEFTPEEKAETPATCAKAVQEMKAAKRVTKIFFISWLF